MVSFRKKQNIFAQGDATDGLFFVQTGKVQLNVVSEAGKEATLAILGEGDFFGEGGLAGQLVRVVCRRNDRLRPSAYREENDDAGNEP
jgi:CRP/FNR family cyclic AMP-dependent transcriptional regulator